MAEAPDDPELYELGELLRKAHTAGDKRSAAVLVKRMDEIENPQWSDMNIPQSIYDTGVKAGEGIVQMVTHPIDTVTGIAKAGYDLATDADTRAGLVHDVKKAYGSPEALKRTIIKDPAGQALIAGSIALPAAGLGMKGAQLVRGAVAAARDVPGTTGISLIPPRSAFPDVATQKPALTAPASGVVPEAAPDTLTMPSTAATMAEEKLYKAMIDAGWTPDRIAAKLRQLGPGATLADVEPFTGLSKTAAQTPRGELRAKQVLGRRDEGREARLEEIIDGTLSPENLHDEIADARKRRTAAAQPKRVEALNTSGIIKSPVIDRMQTTPEFQQGLREGARIAKLEWARTGVEVPKSETWYYGDSLNDPNILIKDTPTLRMLDAAKQGMDSIIQPFRDKYTGELVNPTPYIVEVDKARRAVVQEMRGASPKYGEYLDAWTDESQVMDAMAKGRKILNNDPEITEKALRKMGPEEREAVQIGLARALKDKVGDNPQAAVTLFSKRKTRNKIRAAFATKREYNTFKQALLRERAKARTSRTTGVGSPTVRNALAVADAEAPEPIMKDLAGAALDVATGNKLSLARRAINRITRRKPEDTTTPTLDEMSGVLHSADPDIQQRMITRFRNRASPRAGTGGVLDPEDNF